jgi:8-oxo-dGTP pyrophosphatase MutT (NUDIX family)
VNRDLQIARVFELRSTFEPSPWPWAEANRSTIEAHWAEKTRDKPRMFNGRVLLVSSLDLNGERCRATYFETGFADFLAWRDLGYPDPTIANGYAMGALRGSDGAYVCGVMGGHTANAGRVYFPSGTPDPSDLRPDGTVDLSGSVIRELEEETELDSTHYRAAEDWIVVRRWPAVAFFRQIACTEPAEAVAERIRRNIARQSDPELSDARVIRGPEDIDPRTMPLSVQSFFGWAFGTDRPG